MKERIVVVGFGQCGGNITQEFDRLGFNTFYINTSYDDLKTIESDNKFHIPGAYGSSKNRLKGLEYVKKNCNKITDAIVSTYPTADIFLFNFSLAGGTGSIFGPVMLDIMSQDHPDKIFGAACVIPEFRESIKAKLNAVKCYKDLISIEGLKNLFILDNNHKDKFEINKEFAELYDTLVNITKADSRGIVDPSEVETLLNTRGNTFLSKHNGEIYPLGIFTEFKKGCQCIVTSTKDIIDMDIIEEVTGKPIDSFHGYNNDNDFLGVFGMPFPTKRINELSRLVYEEQEEVILMDDEEEEIIIPKIEFSRKSQDTIEGEKKVDFGSLFDKYK